MLQLRRQRWSLVTNRTYDLDSNKEANEVLEEHDDFDFYLLKQEEDAQKGLFGEKGLPVDTVDFSASDSDDAF